MQRRQDTRKPNALSFGLIFALLMAGAVIMIAGCEPSNTESFTQQYVLQGQMFVGLAPEIRLAHTISLETAYDPSQVGISGADVQLYAWSDTAISLVGPYHLVERAGDPRGNGYYGLAATDTHTVTPGWRYAIRCIVDGDNISAITRAAGFVQITRPADGLPPDTVLYDDQFEYAIRWAHDNLARGYWLIYENINPHHDDDSTLLCANNAGPDKRIGVNASFWNVPPTLDSTNSPPVLFNRDGLHRVRVLSCDSALWTYASTFQPGNPNLRPTTNVRGALGIFCVGGVDTTYFYIAKNPAFHCP